MSTADHPHSKTNHSDEEHTLGGSTWLEETAHLAAPEEPVVLPTLTILAHPDPERIGEMCGLGELAVGSEIAISRRHPHFHPPDAPENARSLADRFLSRRPVRLLPSGDDVVIDAAETSTSVRLNGRTVEKRTISRDDLRRGVLLEFAGRIALFFHLRDVALMRKSRIKSSTALIGTGDAMSRLRASIERIAPTEATVLLRGETGTGKELVARALHDQSGRREAPFIAVNLGTLTPSLASAELFGARKGAYTGATRDSPGYFGRADGGTLFLDEVGEAPVEIQAMLLRVVETGEIVAVGSQTPRRVDVRVVAATDADLEALIESGDFRAPLLHRLGSYTLDLPPLRERREDLGLLLRHFLQLEYEALGTSSPRIDPESRRSWISTDLVRRMALFDWPGNVRQLRNVIRRLVLESSDEAMLTLDPQLEKLFATSPPSGAREPTPPSAREASSSRSRIEEPNREYRKPSQLGEDELLDALRAARWNLKETAAALRISRTSLYSLLERTDRVRAAADVPPNEIRESWRRYGGDLAKMVDDLEISERALRQRLKDLGLR